MTEQQLLTDICKAAGVRPDQITTKGRKTNVVNARHLYMYALRYYFRYGLQRIGVMAGDKYDHTTVIHACKKAEGYLKHKDPQTMRIIDKLLDINPDYIIIYGMKNVSEMATTKYRFPKLTSLHALSRVQNVNT